MASRWVAAAAALLLCAGLCRATIIFDEETGPTTNYTVPEDFLFGAGSSNYQVEGAWNVSDKGMSVLDYGYHTQTRFSSLNHIGDVAADAYHHVEEDVALMEKLKINVYRFSLSWSRVLPNGTTDGVSSDGVAYYQDYIDRLKSKNIEPLITLHHFDHPQIFQDQFSSWLGSEMIDAFVNYADFVFETFGSKVKWWTTVNEANMYCRMVYSMGQTPPGNGTRSTAWYYTCLHNMQVAHARIYHLYQSKYKATQNGTVGFGCLDIDEECMEPVILGDNPSSSTNAIAFSDEEKTILKNSTDYIALNIYGGGGGGGRNRNRTHTGGGGMGGGGMGGGGMGGGGMGGGGMGGGGMGGGGTDGDITGPDGGGPDGGGGLFPPGFNFSDNNFPNFPDGGSVSGDHMLEALRDAWETYQVPIFVTENGVETHGTNDVNDETRAVYCSAQLRAITTAIHYYNVPVLGYTLWSFLDDFEFSRGFNSKYGMVYVDFNSDQRTRTLKDSSEFFIKLMTDKVVPLVTRTSTDTTVSPTGTTHSAAGGVTVGPAGRPTRGPNSGTTPQPKNPSSSSASSVSSSVLSTVLISLVMFLIY